MKCGFPGLFTIKKTAWSGKNEMNKKIDKLIFVYNADSSVFSQVSDAIKKIATPSKYQCNLCMITYGPISMKDEWKKFLETLPFKKEFLHRDEFRDQFPELIDAGLPSIFVFQDNEVKLFISADEINSQKNIEELKKLVQRRLDDA